MYNKRLTRGHPLYNGQCSLVPMESALERFHCILNGTRHGESCLILIYAVISVGKGLITAVICFIAITIHVHCNIIFEYRFFFLCITVVSQSPTSIVASPSANEPGEMDTVNDPHW